MGNELTTDAAVTWLGTDNQTSYNDKLNWSGGAVPLGTGTALFSEIDDAGLNGASIGLSSNAGLAQLDLGDSGPNTLSASFSINNLQLTLNGTGSGKTAILKPANASGKQTISSAIVLTSTQIWNIGGTGEVFVNGGISGAAFGITKTSGGTLELGGTNSFSGPFVVQGGTVIADTASALGADTTDAVQLNSSTSQSNANLLLSNNITLTSNLIAEANGNGKNITIGVATGGGSFNGSVTLNQAIQLDAPASTVLTVQGVISETTPSTVSKIDPGTVILSGTNTFSGGYTARGGTTIIANNQALGASTIALVSGVTATSSASLLTNGGFTVGQNINVQSSVNTAGAGSTSLQYGATLGNAPLQNFGTWSGSIALNQPTNLTAGGTGTALFSGNIVDGVGGTNSTGATYSFVGSSLSKVDGGTVVLAGQNSYSGSTSVQAGLLLVNGVNSGTGAYTVAGSATLGGSGTIDTGAGSAGLQVANGGTLSPGTPVVVGTFSVNGDATLDGTLALRVSDAATDQLHLTGALSINSDATLNVSVTSTLTAPVYILASYGSLTGTFSNLQNAPAGYALNYDYNNADQIAFVSTSTVPEPTAIGGLLLSGAGILRRRRRGVTR